MAKPQQSPDRQQAIKALSAIIATALVDSNQGKSDRDAGWIKLHGKTDKGRQVNSPTGKIIEGGKFGLLRDSNGRPIGHGKLTIEALAEIEVGARELADVMTTAQGGGKRRRTAARK